MEDTLVLTILSVTLLVTAILWKIVHWYNYRKVYNKRQPFKAVYSRNEIEGSSSNIKKEFLKRSNIISGGIGIATLLLVFTIVWQVLMEG